ncbi:hypothetical protein QN277_005192 [Acacia crassicarpa]|uniref:Filament-like plant protein 7 n=1 Tax=Acacia crassicarpa TaxID=499986 RepID=A0AAE1IXP5_9FABA|nr:hypothetical protein QN277_005192 [Acacia crassicarpa]
MNYKPWQWRIRSAEKTMFGMYKSVNPSRTIKEEGQKLLTHEEAGLKKSSKSLNEKLASVLLDCHNADNPSTKHSQKSQEGIPGEDKEKQVKSIERKEEEDLGKEVLDEKVSSGAVLSISRDPNKIEEGLEVKLRETSKRLDDLTIENTFLTSALLSKEKSIEELLKSKHQVDGEFSTIMARLDSMEKENAFLRYEFQILEKELEIRKEEMEYCRQYADASHIQYLESQQKASKLDAECQRLRLLLQEKSPGSSGFLRKLETDTTRRKPSSAIANYTDASEMSISSMIRSLQDLDEENKVLKRILTEKNTQLDSSRFMYTQIASRLSRAEILLRKYFEEHKSMELTRCHHSSDELSSLAKSNTALDERFSSSGSWENAPVSELEHSRTEEDKDQKDNKDIEGPDSNSLDNNVEMEKRAIVSVDTPKRGQCSDSDVITGRELVPVEQDLHFSDSKQETQFKYATFEKSFDWLQIVLNAILEQERISKRNLDELFEDIKIALGRINHPTACRPCNSKSSDVMKSNPHLNANLSKSIHRIIKLIERIAIKSLIYSRFSDDSLEKNQHSQISQSTPSKEYFAHVFKWKITDLNPLLHRFVHTCKDLLVGRADFEKFAEEVAFALDWSINNCGTPTDASFAGEKIKNQSELFHMKNNQSDHIEENKKWNDELKSEESVKKNLEAMLLSVSKENGDLTQQLQEAKSSIEVLQSELEAIKESKGIIEDQFEKQKMINEDLDTQLSIAHTKLNDIFQKFSSLEVKLEDKKISCEELEATCLELQLQLESIVKKESPTPGRDEMEKIYQTGWEITTASSKLAECQGTILNLGKQLKALASSSEAALFERIMAINPTQKSLIRGSSLRSQMQAEDETKEGILIALQIEDDKTSEDVKKTPIFDHSGNNSFLKALNDMVGEPKKDLASKQDERNATKGAKAIIKTKKQGAFDFLRKLFLRKMKVGKRK